ncbi:MAG: hypothetical protein IBJ18_12970, partial [Phycisphaerales bacterium]|nr:hypothetical protein [Phycisphaerales bacterium]
MSTHELAQRRTHSPRRALLAAGALVLFAGANLSAQQVNISSLPSTITAESYRVKFENNRLSIKDLVSGTDIVKDDHAIALVAGQCDTDMKVEAKPDGVDFVLTVKNDSNNPKTPPSLLVSRFLFGDIEAWNFRHGSRKVNVQFPADFSQRSVIGMLRHDYPADAYSPVLVFGNTTHTVGVSVIYDVVGYDHNVFLDLVAAKPGPSSPGPGYFVNITFNAQIPARTTREFRVPVRVARQSQHWLKTLVPYRDHFRQTFGGVQYRADRRPVLGTSLADEAYLGAANPRGFGNSNARVDQAGYTMTVDNLNNLMRTQGYQRIMIWAVSGLNRTHADLNYPFNFATGIDTVPVMAATADELKRLTSPERGIGYWFGNSATPSKPGWDTGGLFPLDLNNSTLVNAVFGEIDRISQLGADTVGLDAFVVASPGTQYRMLSALHERFPNMRFVTELSCSDMIHTLGPTFHYAVDASGPDYLAHFLVPGHETWALPKASHWGALSINDYVAKVNQLALWGYTFVDGLGLSARSSFRAVDDSAL